MFTGSLVAIVTPFRRGKIDEQAFGALIEWQIANGTNGIVPCGTTGESATLSHEEHLMTRMGHTLLSALLPSPLDGEGPGVRCP